MKAVKPAAVSYLTKRVDELTTHPIVQRQLNEQKIAEFEKSINLNAIGVIHVVRYRTRGMDGMWVIDGQHRIVTLQRAGLGEMQVTVALHHEIQDDAAAARLFEALNNRSPVQPFEKFKVRVIAEDPLAIATRDTAARHGLRVFATSSKTTVSCVVALQKLQAAGFLDELLGIAHDAWGKTTEAHEGKLLEGLGAVLMKFHTELDRAALRRTLAKYPNGAAGIMGAAKGMRQWDHGTLVKCVAKVILGEYNKRRTQKLEWA